jgi:hypothetical protein
MFLTIGFIIGFVAGWYVNEKVEDLAEKSKPNQIGSRRTNNELRRSRHTYQEDHTVGTRGRHRTERDSRQQSIRALLIWPRPWTVGEYFQGSLLPPTSIYYINQQFGLWLYQIQTMHRQV